MTDRFIEALAFAAHMHRDQRRKDDAESPYINHCIDVARLLATIGGISDEALLTAALLHDTVEDTAAEPGDLEERFGAEVAGLVAAVTDDKSLPKNERKQLQIAHAPELSDPAKALKIADKISNISDIVERPPVGWSRHRLCEYVDWAERVVDGCRGANPGLETEFDRCAARATRSLSPPA